VKILKWKKMKISKLKKKMEILKLKTNENFLKISNLKK